MSKRGIFQTLILFIFLSAGLFPIWTQAASSYDGRIYLQVQEHGEAWYINPLDHQRYYLGRPEDAYNVMRALGTGITNAQLKQIPIGLLDNGSGDADADGLNDNLELTLGLDPNNPDTDNDDYPDGAEIETNFNPNGPGKITVNNALAQRLRGRILLQVEAHGEAWYVNPNDNRRYYLGRATDAFTVMRRLGVGISNAALQSISSSFPKAAYEATNAITKYYNIKYPTDWTKLTPVTKTKSYKNLSVLDELNLKLPSNKGVLEVFVLEAKNNHTLTDFRLNSSSTSDLTRQDLMVGVKPALKQKNKYSTIIETGDITITRGAELYTDIMLSTKRFIHLHLTIYNEDDVTLYENYFDQMVKSLKILWR